MAESNEKHDVRVKWETENIEVTKIANYSRYVVTTATIQLQAGITCKFRNPEDTNLFPSAPMNLS